MAELGIIGTMLLIVVIVLLAQIVLTILRAVMQLPSMIGNMIWVVAACFVVMFLLRLLGVDPPVPLRVK